MTILHDIGLGRRTLVMGVLNVTPDSFSDGGQFDSVASAAQRALAMLEEGADMIDIGGESTRPATFRDESPLDAATEIERVVPVIHEILLNAPRACISIDTYKPEVASASLAAGATVLNDVSGIGYEPPKMAEIAAKTGAPLIIMHMPGEPRHLPEHPIYNDVIAEIAQHLRTRITLAESVGVDKSQIIIDPGIGFGKNFAQNTEIIRRLPELKGLGYPVLSGPSRKRFLGTLLDNAPPGDRLEGTAAAVALSIAGGADIVRVHDVHFMARVARVCDGILKAHPSSP